MKIGTTGAIPSYQIGSAYKRKPPFIPAGSEGVLSTTPRPRAVIGVYGVIHGAQRDSGMIGVSYRDQPLIPTSGAESDFGRMPKPHKIGVYEPVEIGRNYATPGKERF